MIGLARCLHLLRHRALSCTGLLLLYLVTGALACSDSTGVSGNSTLTGGTTSSGVTSTSGAGDITTTTGTSGATQSAATTSGASSSAGSLSGTGMATTASPLSGSATTTTVTSTATTGNSATTSAGTGATTTGGTGGPTSTQGAGGTGGATTGMGGTGGSSNQAFQPCPEMEPCNVLPLGDSITFGLGFDGGYRVELFRLALENDHDITFTGTQSPNGPDTVEGVAFPPDHEGISGQTIQQIADRVPSPALDEMPHVILVHAGTNDMYQNPNGADSRLAALMDELIAEAPDALIVVSSIIPLPSSADAVDSFNATIPGMVEERANAGAHIIFADQFTGFPTSELGDGVHPNQQGYQRMAQVWFDAIAPYLR